MIFAVKFVRSQATGTLASKARPMFVDTEDDVTTYATSGSIHGVKGGRLPRRSQHEDEAARQRLRHYLSRAAVLRFVGVNLDEQHEEQ